MKNSEAVDNSNTVHHLLHNTDSAPTDDESHTAEPSDSNAPDVSTYYNGNG